MALHNDLTRGDVREGILRFALPLVASNFLQALYNAVDMFFVGVFADTASLSAVSAGGPIMNVMLMAVSGLSIGVSIAIGMHLGAGNKHGGLERCANSCISLYALLSLLVTAAGVALAPELITLIRTPPEAYDMAVEYLRIIFLGTPFLFGYNLIRAFQRGFGDSKTSMYFVLIATVVNIILDYILVAFLNQGASGAAIATVFSQMLSFALGVGYFRLKKHVVTFSPRELRWDREQLGIVLRTGLPASFQYLLINISNVTLNGLANSFGLVASAGYGVAVKLDSFAMLPPSAIGEALAPFSSQNIGARKPDRAMAGLKESLRLCACILVPVILAFRLFAWRFAALFTADGEVIAAAADFLRIYCFSYLSFIGIQPLIGFLRGTGNSIFTMFAVVLAQYIVRIPLAFFVAHSLGLGFNGIAVATIFSPMAALGLYAWAVLSGRWLRSKEMRKALGGEL